MRMKLNITVLSFQESYEQRTKVGTVMQIWKLLLVMIGLTAESLTLRWYYRKT